MRAHVTHVTMDRGDCVLGLRAAAGLVAIEGLGVILNQQLSLACIC